MRHLSPFLLVCLCGSILAGLAPLGAPQAATINLGLEKYMETLDWEAPVSVILIMSEQAPIAALNEALKQERATLQARHEEIVTELRAATRSQAALLTALDAEQGRGRVFGYTSYWIANLVVVQATVEYVYELADREDIDVIEANFTVELIEPLRADLSPEQATRFGATPGLRAINADRVWEELGITGLGTLVANLDTGVDGSHPALGSRWRGNNGHPASECWLTLIGGNPNFPTDGNGHGTHVMGTIAGLGVATGDSIGVAFNAQWIACDAINQGVSSEFDNDVITAYQWFADPDGDPGSLDDVPDVVQNSWRINEGFPGGYTDCDSRWWEVIDNCEAAGVVTTWSAGNEGPGAQTIGSPPDRATTLTNAFSVGAVDATNYNYPWPIAGFSSRGPTGCNVPPDHKIKPEVVAPGVDVYSSIPGGGYTGTYSGTSMAGPHVAGVVGLMREANPDLDVDTLKEIMMATAMDLGTAGEDNTYGWGMVDAYEAVLAVMSGYGTLAGTVSNASNGGTPIPAAEIQVLEIDRTTVTQADGHYQISVPQDTYTVSASHPSFLTGTAYGVVVVEDELTVVDFDLTDIGAPEITETTALRSTENTAGPYLVETDVFDYSDLASVSLHYRVNGGPWQMEPMDGGLDTPYSGAIPGQPQVSHIEYYLEAVDVVNNTATDPVGAPAATYDFYVAPIVAIFTDDMESGSPEMSHEAGPSFGDEWHLSAQRNYTPEGATSWKCGDAGPGDYGNLLDARLMTPEVELSVDSYLHYWQWIDAEVSAAHAGYCYDGGLVEISIDGGAWEQIFPEGGYTYLIRDGSTPGPFPADTEVFSGNVDWHQVHFNLSDYAGMARLRFRFGTDGADVREGWYVDDVMIDGFQIDYADIASRMPGGTFVLRGADPNPFIDRTALSYRLPTAADVQLQVFDLGGRLVRTLVSGPQQPGVYQIGWDGRDDSRRLLPAGIYLTRLHAGPDQATGKVILTR